MRPRTQAIIMTSNLKRAICSDIGLDQIHGDTDKVSRLREYLKNNYQRKDNEEADFCIDNIVIPVHTGTTKMYGRTTEHIPIQFHQKGKIVDFGYETQTILTHQHKIDFNRFALVMKPEDINIEELLNVNFNTISEGKEIVNEMIKNIKQSQINEDDKQKVIQYLQSKINSLEENEENVKKFIVNLDKVSSITFGKETNVFFEGDK